MTKNRLRTFAALLLMLVCALAVFGLTACGGKRAFKFDPEEVTLRITSSSETVTIENAGDDLELTVEDPTIISVDKLYGAIYEIVPLKIGSTTITATSGGKEATCRVTVTGENVVTVYDGDTNVTDGKVEVEMGKTKTLTAESSVGEEIEWSSSDTDVATVLDGVVTGVRPGTAVITAKAAEEEATVTVTVTGGYALLQGAEGDTKALDITGANTGDNLTEDMFWYWAARSQWYMQQVDVEYAYYLEGLNELHFAYTTSTATNVPYGFQVYYKNSKHTTGKVYELSFDININAACTVNINDNLVALKQGDNHVVVYYVYGAGLGMSEGVSSFDLIMGYQEEDETIHFLETAVVTIKDIAWKEITPEKLSTPSFTITNDVISITDSNAAGVGGYMMKFVEKDTNKSIGAFPVQNGKTIDVSAIDSGDYIVSIYAVAESAKYLDSDYSATQEYKVVNENGPSYSLTASTLQNVASTPGKWYYYKGQYLIVEEAKYENHQVTFKFNTNTSYWYDAQLLYTVPDASSEYVYRVSFTLNSTGSGRITINGEMVALQQGDNSIDYYLAANQYDAYTVEIVLGINANGAGTGGTDGEDIPAGMVIIKNFNVEEMTPIPLTAPTFSIANGVITINDPNAADGVKDYVLGFFADSTSTTTLYTIMVAGDEPIDVSSVDTGEYYVRLMVKGSSALYKDSAWSSAVAFDVVNESLSYKMTGNAEKTPGRWTYWTSSWVNIDDNDYADSQLTFTFRNNTGYIYDVQLFYTIPDAVAGKTYVLTFVVELTTSVTLPEEGGKVNIGGTTYYLKAGRNELTVEVTANAEGVAFMQITFGVGDNGQQEITAGTVVISNLEAELKSED